MSRMIHRCTYITQGYQDRKQMAIGDPLQMIKVSRHVEPPPSARRRDPLLMNPRSGEHGERKAPPDGDSPVDCPTSWARTRIAAPLRPQERIEKELSAGEPARSKSTGPGSTWRNMKEYRHIALWRHSSRRCPVRMPPPSPSRSRSDARCRAPA